MEKEREYTWYISPENNLTNEALSRVLDESNFSPALLCEEKRGHEKCLPMWQCDYAIVQRLQTDKARAGYAFKVFVQEGQGKIRGYEFPKRKYPKSKIAAKRKSSPKK